MVVAIVASLLCRPAARSRTVTFRQTSDDSTALLQRLGPLGMRDTGFHVPAAKLDRLASAYKMDPEKKELTFFDDARDSRWAKPLPFPAGGRDQRRRLPRLLPHAARQGPAWP
jgi:CubicO group peptidase (beta-lactamase class C family)